MWSGRAADCQCIWGKDKNAPLWKGSLYYAWMSKVLMKWMEWRLALKCLITGYMDLDCTVFCHLLLFCWNILGFASGYFVYYSCQFYAWYFECCEVRIPGLSFWVWFKIIWKYLFWHYFISVIWQLTVQAVVLVMLSIETGCRRKTEDDNAFISFYVWRTCCWVNSWQEHFNPCA